jgi:hypothetical protein
MLVNERARYWTNVSEEVNEECNTNYTSDQCQSKFNKMVSEYNVSIIIKQDNHILSTLLIDSIFIFKYLRIY